LDIGGRDPKKDGEWYGKGESPPFPPGMGETASYCAYTFRDTPSQPQPLSEKPINKVTISFRLELVKVACGAKNGGEVVLTINWGFWYTKDENGLLNND
jgi:hypothetical protein